MNERIKELWEQAAKTTQGDSWEEQTKFIENFAELIVKECMDIARDVANISDPADFALDRCYEIEQRIQDRFGVEE